MIGREEIVLDHRYGWVPRPDSRRHPTPVEAALEAGVEKEVEAAERLKGSSL